jgi:hypothetical protein
MLKHVFRAAPTDINVSTCMSFVDGIGLHKNDNINRMKTLTVITISIAYCITSFVIHLQMDYGKPGQRM